MKRLRHITPKQFKALLFAGLIRPASLNDVEGTQHKRPLYRHPNTHQFFVASPKHKEPPMQVLSRPQRQALARVYTHTQQTQKAPLTYRQFRRLATPTIGCDGAITIPFAGMWLCIERDGYTHS